MTHPSPYKTSPDAVARVQQQVRAGLRTYTIGETVSVKRETDNATILAISNCYTCAVVTVEYGDGRVERVAADRLSAPKVAKAAKVSKPRTPAATRVRAPRNSEQAKQNTIARKTARKAATAERQAERRKANAEAVEARQVARRKATADAAEAKLNARRQRQQDGYGRKYGPQDRENAEMLRYIGLNYGQMSEVTGISRRALAKWCAGLPEQTWKPARRGGIKPQYGPEYHVAVHTLRGYRLSYVQIARLVGINTETVGNWLRKREPTT